MYVRRSWTPKQMYVRRSWTPKHCTTPAQKRKYKRVYGRWYYSTRRGKDATARRLARQFGLDVKMVRRLRRRPCEVCGHKTKRANALDHNHRTGKFRGVLCYYCNRALGLLKDSPRLARRLARYAAR